MESLWFIGVPFGAFIVWLMFRETANSIKCPDCGAPVPFWQSPFTKSWRQWLEGGYACQKCGCEIDTAGHKVVAGAVPISRYAMLGLVLLAIFGSLGVALTLMLIRR